MTPLFQTIPCDNQTPVSLYLKLASRRPHAFLLESAEEDVRIGRYSVIGFDPLHLYVFPGRGNANPLKELSRAFGEIAFTPEPRLPRFQAPFVGYLSYETVRHFEAIDLPESAGDIPEGIFFMPRYMLIFDHFEQSLTAVAYETGDLAHLMHELSRLKEMPGPTPLEAHSLETEARPPSSAEPAHFAERVLQAKERISAGEIFQVVLSQHFDARTEALPFDLYRRLRLKAPSSYMYYLQYPDFSIIGSSPETLVRTEGEDVIVRPIAGTRRRGKNPQEDLRLQGELLSDKKEQAEHMMLVDLGRNDIGRVCEPGSIEVKRCMELNVYSHVMHLVSEVRGRRRHDVSAFDIFRATFPAGTLTGAPKIRAMEIIAELERSPRGIYGGAVGYFDLTGAMDFAIAIRTMLYKNGAISLRAGAGIVYDSVPEMEDKECRNKARGPLSALTH